MSDLAGELLVFELFEELLDLPPVDRALHLERRLVGRLDTGYLTTRVLRLVAIEEGMGEPGIGTNRLPLLDALVEANPSTAHAELEPGAHFADFEILARIGRGGMGTVYRARQSEPARDVALKVLVTGPLSGPGLAHRFRQEGHLLARLTHPNVAAIYSMGVSEGTEETPWIAVEFVADAKDLVTFARASGLDRRARVRLLLSALDAVHHGHQKGIVHRDLKPDNLLVGSDGRVKVIDFGVSSLLDRAAEDLASASRSAPTLSAELHGTLPYMAPELLLFESGQASGVDVRVDVFALGVVLFELLLGHRPREVSGRLSRAALQLLFEEPLQIPPGQLPAPLEWVVRRALASDPNERYPSAEAFARDLLAYLAHQPVEARVLARPLARRRYLIGTSLRRNWSLVSATLLVILGLGGALVWSQRSAAAEAHQYERAQDLTSDLFGMSLALVTDLAQRVAQLEGSLDVRREMIQSGLTQLEELVAESDDLPPGMTLGLARAHLALGDVLGNVLVSNLGDFERAGEAYARAGELLASLPPDFARSLAAGLVAAQWSRRLGTLARGKGDWDAALANYADWGRKLEALRPQATGVELAQLELELALSWVRRGTILGQVHDDARGAVDAVESGIAVYRRVLADPPLGLDGNYPLFLLQEALSISAAGYSQLDEKEACRAARAESRAILNQLREADPTNAQFSQVQMGRALSEVYYRREDGDFRGSIEVAHEARGLLQTRLASEPTNPRLQANLPILDTLMGQTYSAWESARRAGPVADGTDLDLVSLASSHFTSAVQKFEALEAQGTLTGQAVIYLEEARRGLRALDLK